LENHGPHGVDILGYVSGRHISVSEWMTHVQCEDVYTMSVHMEGNACVMVIWHFEVWSMIVMGDRCHLAGKQ
jgi:hypothetical protein